MNFHGDNLRPAENTYTIGPDSKNIRRMQQEVFDMISFDELKSRALDLTQSGVAKAKELTDVAKLNIANSTEEDNIRKAYIELGKLYYAERGMAPEGAYAALCERITVSKQKIEENRAKISEIKAANDVSDDVCGCGCCSAETEVAPEEPAAPVEDPKPEEPRQ